MENASKYLLARWDKVMPQLIDIDKLNQGKIKLFGSIIHEGNHFYILLNLAISQNDKRKMKFEGNRLALLTSMAEYIIEKENN